MITFQYLEEIEHSSFEMLMADSISNYFRKTKTHEDISVPFQQLCFDIDSAVYQTKIPSFLDMLTEKGQDKMSVQSLRLKFVDRMCIRRKRQKDLADLEYLKNQVKGLIKLQNFIHKKTALSLYFKSWRFRSQNKYGLYHQMVNSALIDERSSPLRSCSSQQSCQFDSPFEGHHQIRNNFHSSNFSQDNFNLKFKALDHWKRQSVIKHIHYQCDKVNAANKLNSTISTSTNNSLHSALLRLAIVSSFTIPKDIKKSQEANAQQQRERSAINISKLFRQSLSSKKRQAFSKLKQKTAKGYQKYHRPISILEQIFQRRPRASFSQIKVKNKFMWAKDKLVLPSFVIQILSKKLHQAQSWYFAKWNGMSIFNKKKQVLRQKLVKLRIQKFCQIIQTSEQRQIRYIYNNILSDARNLKKINKVQLKFKGLILTNLFKNKIQSRSLFYRWLIFTKRFHIIQGVQRIVLYSRIKPYTELCRLKRLIGEKSKPSVKRQKKNIGDFLFKLNNYFVKSNLINQGAALREIQRDFRLKKLLDMRNNALNIIFSNAHKQRLNNAMLKWHSYAKDCTHIKNIHYLKNLNKIQMLNLRVRKFQIANLKFSIQVWKQVKDRDYMLTNIYKAHTFKHRAQKIPKLFIKPAFEQMKQALFKGRSIKKQALKKILDVQKLYNIRRVKFNQWKNKADLIRQAEIARLQIQLFQRLNFSILSNFNSLLGDQLVDPDKSKFITDQKGQFKLDSKGHKIQKINKLVLMNQLNKQVVLCPNGKLLQFRQGLRFSNGKLIDQNQIQLKDYKGQSILSTDKVIAKVAVTKLGQLVKDQTGKPIIIYLKKIPIQGSSKQYLIDKDGKLVTDQKGIILRASQAKSKIINGKKLYIDSHGNPINLKEVSVLMDENDQPFIDQQGKPILLDIKPDKALFMVDSQDNLVLDKKGNPIAVKNLTAKLVDEKLVYLDQQGHQVQGRPAYVCIANGQPLRILNGKAALLNPKPIAKIKFMADKNGKLILDSKGNPILQSQARFKMLNGKKIYVDKQGNQSGCLPIQVIVDHKNSPIIGSDGNPILGYKEPDTKSFLVGKDNRLLRDKYGKFIQTKNAKKVVVNGKINYIDQKGNPYQATAQQVCVDRLGNPLFQSNGQAFILFKVHPSKEFFIIDSKGNLALDKKSNPLLTSDMIAKMNGERIVYIDERGNQTDYSSAQLWMSNIGKPYLNKNQKPVPSDNNLHTSVLFVDNKGVLILNKRGKPLSVYQITIKQTQGQNVYLDESGNLLSASAVRLYLNQHDDVIYQFGNRPAQVNSNTQNISKKKYKLDQKGKLVLGSDGKPIQPTKQQIQSGAPGFHFVLCNSDGLPLLGKDGKPIKTKNRTPQTSNLVIGKLQEVLFDSQGKPLTPDKITPQITSMLTGPSCQAYLVDKDNKLILDKKGKPIKARNAKHKLADGKIIYLDQNGKPIDCQLQLVVQDKSGQPIVKPNGKVMKATSNNQKIQNYLVDKNGNLVRDRSGKPILSSQAKSKNIDGVQVFLDQRGNPTDYTAQDVFVDQNDQILTYKNGQIITPDNQPDTKAFLIDKAGFLIIQRKKAIQTNLHHFKMQGSKKIYVDQSGVQLACSVEHVYIDEKGEPLINKSGKPMLAKDCTTTRGYFAVTESNKLIFGQNGNPVLSFYNKSEGQQKHQIHLHLNFVNLPFIDVQQNPVSTELQLETKVFLQDSSGNLLKNGKGKPLRMSDLQIKYVNGKQQYLDRGQPINARPKRYYTTQSGQIVYELNGKPAEVHARNMKHRRAQIALDSQGKPVLDQKGNLLDLSSLKSKQQNGKTMYFDNKGNQIKCEIKQVYTNKQGEPMTGNDGKAILANSQPVKTIKTFCQNHKPIKKIDGKLAVLQQGQLNLAPPASAPKISSFDNQNTKFKPKRCCALMKISLMLEHKYTVQKVQSLQAIRRRSFKFIIKRIKIAQNLQKLQKKLKDDLIQSSQTAINVLKQKSQARKKALEKLKSVSQIMLKNQKQTKKQSQDQILNKSNLIKQRNTNFANSMEKLFRNRLSSYFKVIIEFNCFQHAQARDKALLAFFSSLNLNLALSSVQLIANIKPSNQSQLQKGLNSLADLFNRNKKQSLQNIKDQQKRKNKLTSVLQRINDRIDHQNDLSKQKALHELQLSSQKARLQEEHRIMVHQEQKRSKLEKLLLKQTNDKKQNLRDWDKNANQIKINMNNKLAKLNQVLSNVFRKPKNQFFNKNKQNSSVLQKVLDKAQNRHRLQLLRHFKDLQANLNKPDINKLNRHCKLQQQLNNLTLQRSIKLFSIFKGYHFEAIEKKNRALFNLVNKISESQKFALNKLQHNVKKDSNVKQVLERMFNSQNNRVLQNKRQGLKSWQTALNNSQKQNAKRKLQDLHITFRIKINNMKKFLRGFYILDETIQNNKIKQANYYFRKLSPRHIELLRNILNRHRQKAIAQTLQRWRTNTWELRVHQLKSHCYSTIKICKIYNLLKDKKTKLSVHYFRVWRQLTIKKASAFRALAILRQIFQRKTKDYLEKLKINLIAFKAAKFIRAMQIVEQMKQKDLRSVFSQLKAINHIRQVLIKIVGIVKRTALIPAFESIQGSKLRYLKFAKVVTRFYKIKNQHNRQHFFKLWADSKTLRALKIIRKFFINKNTDHLRYSVNKIQHHLQKDNLKRKVQAIFKFQDSCLKIEKGIIRKFIIRWRTQKPNAWYLRCIHMMAKNGELNEQVALYRFIDGLDRKSRNAQASWNKSRISQKFD